MKEPRGVVFLAALFFVFFAGVLPGWAEVRIAVFPFTYKDAEQKSPWLPAAVADILSSRLYVPKQVSVVDQARIKAALQEKKGGLTKELMKSVGGEVGAQSFVAGTIGEQGETITLSAELIPVEPFAPSGTFSMTCNGREEMIGKVNELAKEMRLTLTGAAPKETLFAPMESGGSKVAVGAVREEALGSDDQVGRGVETQSPVETGDIGKSPLPPPSPAITVWPCFWQSEVIDERVRGIAVGDVDGDKGNEVLLLTDQEVLVVRKTESGLERLGKYRERSACRLLRIESGDINANGISELFVTSVREKPSLGAGGEYQKERGEALASFVLEWKEKKLEKIAENLPWFLSVLPNGPEGPVLWGQEAGKDAALDGALLRLGWTGERYEPAGDAGLPKGLQVLGMGILVREGTREYFQLDPHGGLSVYNAAGEVTWFGNEFFGGSDQRITLVGLGSDRTLETVTMPLRVLVRDLNNDQEDDILVGKNAMFKTGVLGRTLTLEKGAVSWLVWKGDHMEIRGRTADRTEGVVDYCVADGDDDGKEELIVVMRLPESSFSLHPKSYVAFYDLN